MWELDCEESWAPKNWCFWTVVLEKALESPLDCKEIQPVHPKGDQSWVFIGRTDWSWNSNTLATSCEELTHWKRPWCWEGLGAGGEQDDRGWGGWMASPTPWIWVWVDSKSWWWTGRPGMLGFMGSQRVGHDWGTELNWWSILILSVVQNESDFLENKPMAYCSKFNLCQQWHLTQSKKSVQGILCKVWELRADLGLVTQAFQPYLLCRISRILLWRLQKAGWFSPLEIHLQKLRTWPPKKNWVCLTIQMD